MQIGQQALALHHGRDLVAHRLDHLKIALAEPLACGRGKRGDAPDVAAHDDRKAGIAARVNIAQALRLRQLARLQGFEDHGGAPAHRHAADPAIDVDLDPAFALLAP